MTIFDPAAASIATIAGILMLRTTLLLLPRD